MRKAVVSETCIIYRYSARYTRAICMLGRVSSSVRRAVDRVGSKLTVSLFGNEKFFFGHNARPAIKAMQ